MKVDIGEAVKNFMIGGTLAAALGIFAASYADAPTLATYIWFVPLSFLYGTHILLSGSKNPAKALVQTYRTYTVNILGRLLYTLPAAWVADKTGSFAYSSLALLVGFIPFSVAYFHMNPISFTKA